MKLFTTILLLLLVYYASASDTLRTVTAVRINESPKIDGILEETVWQKGISTGNFRQSRPDFDKLPTQRTEVKIIYDDRAVYIGAIMYDTAPDSVLHQLGRRDDDNLNADDFYFKIDPIHNDQDAYQFGVNAAGVQFDSKFSDFTFDAVWNSAVKITDFGWVAEIEIPYSAIRFPKTSIQDWGIQMTRNIRRIREIDQWALIPLTASNAQMYWGSIQGIEQINSPLRLSFTPYLAATMDRQPIRENDNRITYSNSYSYNAGADIKYGIDDRFTLDMILLPDFGQVQSDKKVKNLSYNEVVFDENRPFFKEGVELFGKDDLFYSRRIGKTPSGFFNIYNDLNEGESVIKNPSQVRLLNAFKISGRTNKGLGLGIFNAVTNNTYAEIEDSSGNVRKVLTEPFTDFNIIVVDQQLKNNSGFYVINTHTNRDKGFSDANVTGAGFRLSNKKNTFLLEGTGALSERSNASDEENIFEAKPGYKYMLKASKNGGFAQYGISRSEVNEEFNASDLGYFIIPGYTQYSGFASIQQYKKWRFIRESFHDINSYVTTNYTTGDIRQAEFSFNSFFNLLSFNAFFVGGGIAPLKMYDYQESRTDGRKFRSMRYFYHYYGISTDYRKKVAVDIQYTNSGMLNEFTHDPYHDANIAFRFRINNHLFIKTYNAYIVDLASVGFAYADENDKSVLGLRRLETYENSVNISYIFKNDMLLTVTGRHYWSTGNYNRYFDLDEDGELQELNFINNENNFSSNFFNIDVVYEWRFAPGSFLNLVYKNAIETDGQLLETRFNKNLQDVINSPQNNIFSIKVLYFLDYIRLRKRN